MWNKIAKLSNDETVVIKPPGRFSKSFNKPLPSMIMQHLLNENTCKKLDSYNDNKIQSKLLRFARQHKMCFTEPKWRFLNDKHHEVRNFYGLPKTHESIIIKSTINTQNSEIIDIFELNYLKLRPIVGGSKCPARKISQLIDILLKPFLKHINSFIRDSLDFLIKCPRNVDEDTEIVTFDVISLYTSITHKFGLEALD